MQNKKVIVLNDLNGKTFKFTIDRSKLSKGIFSAIEGIGCTKSLQPTFVNNTKVKSVKLKDKKVESKMPSLQDVVSNHQKSSNSGEGTNYFYNKKSLSYPKELNPFTPALSKIRLNKNENAVLAKFLDAVRSAESLDELNKIVETALSKLKRINAPNKGLWCFADAVLFRILDTFPEGAQDIIHKLILKGATFDDDLLQVDERINKTHNQLQQELQPQLHNQLTELRKVAENASITGTVQNVEFDNRTFYMEFSKGSVVDVDKITSGTRNLGFDRGNLNLGGDIVKIGNSEIELKVEKDGKINYLDLSDNSSVKITFHTNRGDIEVKLFHDQNHHNEVQVRVNDPELWEKFKTEAVVKNCLLGGVPIEKAVEEGYFTRCGKLGREKDLPNEKDTWVSRVLKGSAVTSLER